MSRKELLRRQRIPRKFDFGITLVVCIHVLGISFSSNHPSERVKIHPASVNKTHGDFESLWLAYHQKVKTSQVFVRDSTMVYPYGLLLFGGELELHHDTGVITVRWGVSSVTRAWTWAHEMG